MPQPDRTFAPGYVNYTGPRLFGAPIGDLSAFQTVLGTLAIGVASFFAATFFGILGVSVMSIARHRMLDYSIAYKWVGLPVGLLMLFGTGLYLGSILIRRVTGEGR
ncbi:hypothetical protein [Terriglobus sp.]|uniref:hypothetical protein n=1 Tax=Terriglobus sp. TaxID=1889013 RepID=UPI003B0069E5